LSSVINHIHETAYVDKVLIRETYNRVKTARKIEVLHTSSCHSRVIYFKKVAEQLQIICDPLFLSTLYWTTFYDYFKSQLENVHL
jgi:hypothetical protein